MSSTGMPSYNTLLLAKTACRRQVCVKLTDLGMDGAETKLSFEACTEEEQGTINEQPHLRQPGEQVPGFTPAAPAAPAAPACSTMPSTPTWKPLADTRSQSKQSNKSLVCVNVLSVGFVECIHMRLYIPRTLVHVVPNRFALTHPW
jgi:hypothetical protein